MNILTVRKEAYTRNPSIKKVTLANKAPGKAPTAPRVHYRVEHKGQLRLADDWTSALITLDELMRRQASA